MKFGSPENTSLWVEYAANATKVLYNSVPKKQKEIMEKVSARGSSLLRKEKFITGPSNDLEQSILSKRW